MSFLGQIMSHLINIQTSKVIEITWDSVFILYFLGKVFFSREFLLRAVEKEVINSPPFPWQKKNKNVTDILKYNTDFICCKI